MVNSWTSTCHSGCGGCLCVGIDFELVVRLALSVMINIKSPTLAVSCSPNAYREVENRFLRPSYAPRGLNTFEATRVCSASIISKHRAGGNVFSDDIAVGVKLVYVVLVYEEPDSLTIRQMNATGQ